MSNPNSVQQLAEQAQLRAIVATYTRSEIGRAHV